VSNEATSDQTRYRLANVRSCVRGMTRLDPGPFSELNDGEIIAVVSHPSQCPYRADSLPMRRSPAVGPRTHRSVTVDTTRAVLAPHQPDRLSEARGLTSSTAGRSLTRGGVPHAGQTRPRRARLDTHHHHPIDALLVHGHHGDRGPADEQHMRVGLTSTGALRDRLAGESPILERTCTEPGGPLPTRSHPAQIRSA
jgi:hypothetical protein